MVHVEQGIWNCTKVHAEVTRPRSPPGKQSDSGSDNQTSHQQKAIEASGGVLESASKLALPQKMHPRYTSMTNSRLREHNVFASRLH
jgi:hypothetical protein